MAKKKVFSFGNALAEGLEETIAAAHNYSGELRVEVIPIKRIEVDPENPRDLAINFEDLFNGIADQDPERARKLTELDSLLTIANSIRDQGIINPIVVYKFGEKYRLIAGERRTLASILANKTDIQAKILDSKPSELKISLLQWIENIERSDLSLGERLTNLSKIVDAYASKKNIASADVSITELSNLIGCTKPHAMNYKAVLNADEKLKQLIQENQIKNLEKAAVIAEINFPEVKERAIHACLSGWTLKQLKVLAEQATPKIKLLPTAERRGRQATQINLGLTKNKKVARFIFDAILATPALTHVHKQFQSVDWDDHRAMSDSFKKLVKALEEIHD